MVPNRASLSPAFVLALFLGSLCAVGCGGPTTDDASGRAGHPMPVSLVQQWADVEIDDGVSVEQAAPLADLRFDGSTPGLRWKVVGGIDGLRVEDGKLVGRTTDTTPTLLLEVPDGLGGGDELWAAELQVRATAGTRTRLHPLRRPGPPMPVVLARSAEWPLSSPLLATPGSTGSEPRPGDEAGEGVDEERATDDEISTYRIELDDVFLLEMPLATRNIRQLVVQPTDVADAEFELAGVRLVFRQEYLASIDSGPGWHGLGEVFRETLVSRAPETLGFRLTLPERPWLHLAVGSAAPVPPRFQVLVQADDAEPELVAELAVDRPEQWRPERLDLSAWAGRSVELQLRALSEAGGAGEEGAGSEAARNERGLDRLAFWGAPTVRSALPPSSATSPGPTAAEGTAAESPSTEPPATESTGTPSPRLVVVFLCDTLRADHLEAYGYGRETAPNVARLAAEGVRFADVMAQATWTKASVSSILTSLHPATVGVADLNDRVSAGEVTLAEAFRAAGYATFATSSVPFSGQLTNLHQGVEVLHEFGAVERDESGYQSKTASHWVPTFLDWLELHRDVPAFAFVHVMDPHSPFEPRAPFDTLWADEGSTERFRQQATAVEPHIESPLLQRFMAPSADELAAAGVDAASFVEHEKAWYDGSIRGMDAQLGSLVERMESLGLVDDGLLAFVADHGEGFLEHGLHWHGNSVYGELTHVPMVLWGGVLDRQGLGGGQVVESTVQALDLMPTLLDLARLEIPERAQGRSLVPILRGEEGPESRSLPAFSEQRRPPREGRPPHDSFAMVKDEWKLIWNVNPPEGVPAHELFRHDTDPLDLEDVADAHPEVVARLAPELERWLKWAEGARLDEAAFEAEVSAEELEQLRSLGYVQ